MKEIDDKELDVLMSGYFERRETVDSINRQVMKTIRRNALRHRLCLAARLLMICFGMPLVVVALVFVYYSVIKAFPTSLPIKASMFVAALTCMAVGIKTFNIFTSKL